MTAEKTLSKLFMMRLDQTAMFMLAIPPLLEPIYGSYSLLS